jgi:hypothetical protein
MESFGKKIRVLICAKDIKEKSTPSPTSWTSQSLRPLVDTREIILIKAIMVTKEITAIIFITAPKKIPH